jgi:hypothetical protein
MADAGASRSAALNRERVRRWAQRQREPTRIVYRVEVARDRIINRLIDAHWIAESDAWRRDLIELALSEVLETIELPEKTP